MRVSLQWVAFSHLGLLPLMTWTMRVGASTGLSSGGAWRVSQRVTPLNVPLSARTVVGVVVRVSVEGVVTGMDGVAGGAVSLGAGVAVDAASVRASVAGVWACVTWMWLGDVV